MVTKRADVRAARQTGRCSDGSQTESSRSLESLLSSRLQATLMGNDQPEPSLTCDGIVPFEVEPKREG